MQDIDNQQVQKSYGFESLQKTILVIMSAIHELCEQEGIEYYLMGGSALGAARHGGFIPWDDDLDIFMTYENYARFLEVANEKLDDERFYLQQECSNEWPMPFSKIRMNGTTYLEKIHAGRDVHQGIFVDIFCLNKAPESEWIRTIQFYTAKVIIAKGLSQLNYHTSSTTKKAAIMMSGLLPKPFVYGPLLKFVRSFNRGNSSTQAHIFGKAPYKACYYDQSVLGNPREVEFDGYKLKAPEHLDTYLTLRFGDYMQIPSDDQIKAAQHALKFDVSRDYREFI